MNEVKLRLPRNGLPVHTLIEVKHELMEVFKTQAELLKSIGLVAMRLDHTACEDIARVLNLFVMTHTHLAETLQSLDNFKDVTDYREGGTNA